MSLSRAVVAELADALFEAEKSGRQIAIPSVSHPAITLDDAYAVQKALVERKVAAGATPIGWKIGLTSRAMQAALAIDTPDSGVLLDDMTFQSGSMVPPGRFIEPRVEAEIAFVMKDDLEPDATRDDVIEATGHVAAALEILDTRVVRRDPATGAMRKVFDTVADNAANAGIVMSDVRHPVGAFDLRRVGAIVKRDGIVEETGLGAGVLDDPASGLAWLVRRLAEQGDRIRAGDVVLSGSFIRPIECPPGAGIHADFAQFGTVAIRFA